ncbi:MAG: DUF5667 domain-containing protein [Dehalococcoidia bacterium]|nr:DUF5667 domain-containing protein [Dehalococcoidia bacterium]
MGDKRITEDVLNECLEDVRAGRRTVEQCLARHPEQAGELEPLLKLALNVGKAAGLDPGPEFKARARHRFQEAVHSRAERRFGKRPVWWRAWAMAVAAMLAVAVLGSGTVAASDGSTPDQPLYPVKMAKEQVQLFLTRPPLARARLNGALAEARLREIEAMAVKGNLEQVSKLTDKLDHHLADMEDQGKLSDEEASALRDILETRAIKHLVGLKSLEQRAPPAVRPILDKALRLSEARFEKALRSAGVKPAQMEKIRGRWQKGLREGRVDPAER